MARSFSQDVTDQRHLHFMLFFGGGWRISDYGIEDVEPLKESQMSLTSGWGSSSKNAPTPNA